MPYRTRSSESDRFQSLSGFNDVKLLPFNGKEDWKVWVSRYEAIAERRSWSNEIKSNQIDLGKAVFMPPTSKKLEEHIASGLFVRPSFRPSVRSSRFLMHSITLEP